MTLEQAITNYEEQISLSEEQIENLTATGCHTSASLIREKNDDDKQMLEWLKRLREYEKWREFK